ncbi:MAG: TetR/AcrR family transcriptional regulator [Candidatus Binataceae bacterium]
MAGLQEERSAETRRKLLDATLECLFECGYAGTTTVEIARRAGVSRGAQLHHFPRKEELVVRALVHVFDLRLKRFREVTAELPAGGEAKVNALIDMLWLAFKGPTFYAWLELVVASRTNSVMRQAVSTASAHFARGVHEVFNVMFGSAAPDSPAGSPLEFVIFGLLEAMALERVLIGCEEDERVRIGQSLSAVKAIATFMVRGMPTDGAKRTANKAR